LGGLVLRSKIESILGLLLFLAAASVSPLTGQERVRRMTLDEAVQLFNQNNLELRLSRATSLAAAGAARQLRAYPNPVASVTHESISDLGISYSETYYTLTQPIDWPWRYRDRRTAGSQVALAAAAELRADSAEFLFALKRAYVDAAAAEAAWEILGQVTMVFRQADQSGSARLEEGDISNFELKRIRVERARYEQRWIELELELAGLRRRLASLTVPGQTGLQVAPDGPLSGNPPSLSVDPLLSQALASRGEIAAATASTKAAREFASVARWSRLPEPALTGGYKRQSDGFDGLFLGMAVPLPWWDRKGGEVDAANATVEATEAQEQLAHVRVANDVTTTAENYRSLERRAALIGGELLADVDDLLDVALLSYTEGELSLLELLDAAQAYSDASLAKVRLSAAYWTAYYDLERAVGGFAAFDGQRLEDR
jgi:cobalt-zinc-cadmium efflux system outer membrane protein